MDTNNINGYLLGDSGYPSQPWLLTPVLGAEPNTPEARFNDAHRHCRNIIEKLNGVLKGRFRCLKRDRTLHYMPNKAGCIVYASAVLHNICILRNIELEEELIAQEEIEDVPDIAINVANENNNVLVEGLRRRRTIINQYFQ